MRRSGWNIMVLKGILRGQEAIVHGRIQLECRKAKRMSSRCLATRCKELMRIHLS